MIINKNKIVSLSTIIFLTIVFIILNFTSFFNIVYSKINKNNVKKELPSVYVGGECVGIKLLATGVLVMDVDREDTDLKIGDIILKVNDQKIESNLELVDFAKKSNGENLNLEVNRNGEIINVTLTPIMDSLSNEYKLGLWVKDSSAGIGTITFYKEDGKFAALGHGVTETKQNQILPITSGAITFTNVFDVKKGEANNPGELKGTLTDKIVGEILSNSKVGIFGKMDDSSYYSENELLPLTSKFEVKEGKAKIEKLEKKVKEILELSISKGITYIITNSEPGWVKYSCCRFLPEVLPILKRVKIISSRSLYQNIFPNDSKIWKIKTFNLVYKSCNRSLPSNIICIGDCNGDIQAGKNLANKFNECSLKTIKFIDSPTIDELSNQICLVYDNFDCIFSAQNNWDIVVQKRINGKI